MRGYLGQYDQAGTAIYAELERGQRYSRSRAEHWADRYGRPPDDGQNLDVDLRGTPVPRAE